MNRPKRLAIIAGARPNFIKAAPLFKQAKKHPEFEFNLIHTGQHFDPNMSQVFFDQLELPKPDIYLDVKGQYHTEKIGKMFDSLKRVFNGYRFDACVVFGDVNSTLAGAIATIKNNYPLIHVEAGLRSHDRRMPEEITRAVVDHLSDLLFTTEEAANENLLKEGVDPEKVKYVGNIMIEGIESFWDKILVSRILEKLGLKPKTYVVATIHRQENTDDSHNLEDILKLLQKINSSIPVVFPLHYGTQKKIMELDYGSLLQNLKITEPLGYFDFLNLVINSSGVITDSGGIQEETTHLGIPCATFRDNTERPITIEIGSNKLFSIRNASPKEVLTHLGRTDFKSRHIPLWDDKVSERIFAALKEELL